MFTAAATLSTESQLQSSGYDSAEVKSQCGRLNGGFAAISGRGGGKALKVLLACSGGKKSSKQAKVGEDPWRISMKLNYIRKHG